ncbi:hypothetical protein BN1044_03250 [Hafnia alvei]|uniref:Uncharacterized protein n=1 Tax=Hafnia alvei TaxID=569 RepID=A0A1C6Z3Y2_HAFAL|nr:hypothetical protein BN1044_03250 [Hafnia alvei]
MVLLLHGNTQALPLRLFSLRRFIKAGIVRHIDNTNGNTRVIHAVYDLCKQRGINQ